MRAPAFALLLALIAGASCNAIIGLESPSGGSGGAPPTSAVAAGAPCDGNTCDDGKIDCDETGVDCGGRDCKACGGAPCEFNEDCQSRACVAALGICCDEPCPNKDCQSCGEVGFEGKCVSLQAGTPCMSVYHCNAGECQADVGLGDACSKDSDCQTLLCHIGKCLGAAGWLCGADSDCASNDCDGTTGCVGP